jgi:hypothetical protein
MYARGAESFAPPAPPANRNAACHVVPLPLNRVQHPRLRAALIAWNELTGDTGGVYDRARRGFGPLLGKPEIVNDRTSVIVCDGADPLGYLIAYWGGGFGVHKDKSFVARRVCDLLGEEEARAVTAAYREVICERRPRAHRVTARYGDQFITYDRIVLPTTGDDGEVDRLITLSVELERRPAPV